MTSDPGKATGTYQSFSQGLVRQGYVVLIYDPIGNDWALCEKGSGAWLYRTDGAQEQMFMRPSGPLEQMIGIANTGFFDLEMRRKILSNLAEVRLFTSYRCAAHEYRLLGQGHMDFAMYNKLMPWDHLGGALMMQEAGAHVARFDGSPYLPHHTSGGLLVASDADAWQELRERIFDPFYRLPGASERAGGALLPTLTVDGAVGGNEVLDGGVEGYQGEAHLAVDPNDPLAMEKVIIDKIKKGSYI